MRAFNVNKRNTRELFERVFGVDPTTGAFRYVGDLGYMVRTDTDADGVLLQRAVNMALGHIPIVSTAFSSESAKSQTSLSTAAPEEPASPISAVTAPKLVERRISALLEFMKSNVAELFDLKAKLKVARREMGRLSRANDKTGSSTAFDKIKDLQRTIAAKETAVKRDASEIKTLTGSELDGKYIRTLYSLAAANVRFMAAQRGERSDAVESAKAWVNAIEIRLEVLRPGKVLSHAIDIGEDGPSTGYYSQLSDRERVYIYGLSQDYRGRQYVKEALARARRSAASITDIVNELAGAINISPEKAFKLAMLARQELPGESVYPFAQDASQNVTQIESLFIADRAREAVDSNNPVQLNDFFEDVIRRVRGGELPCDKVLDKVEEVEKSITDTPFVERILRTTIQRLSEIQFQQVKISEDIYKSVSLLHTKRIEIIAQQDAMVLTDTMNRTIRNMNTNHRAEARKKGDTEKDILTYRLFSNPNNLSEILSVPADPGGLRVVITSQQFDNDDDGKKREEYIRQFGDDLTAKFSETRLLNVMLPAGYSEMNENEKSFHLHRLVMIAVLGRLLDEKDDIGKLIFEKMIEGYVKGSAKDFISNLTRSEGSWTTADRLKYFLGNTVSLLENLIREYELLKLRMRTFYIAA